MIKVRDAISNSNHFDIQINSNGTVQLSFGPAHICMTLDSTYELQYQLAEVLAGLELQEYPTERDDEMQGLFEGRQTLEALASHTKTKRGDS